MALEIGIVGAILGATGAPIGMISVIANSAAMSCDRALLPADAHANLLTGKAVFLLDLLRYDLLIFVHHNGDERRVLAGERCRDACHPRGTVAQNH